MPFTTTPTDLEATFSAAEAMELRSVIVYGRTLAAYTSLAVLSGRGMNMNKVLEIKSRIVDCLPLFFAFF